MLHRLRSPLLAALTLLLLVAAMQGCQGAGQPRRAPGAVAPRPAAISHFVFAKLKNPDDASELIADCDAMLGTLPMVAAYACGRHLDTGRGAPVDANYDVGMYMGFATVEDYNAYVDHPSHVAIVTKWQPRWEWLRVQDVSDPTP